MGPSVHVCATTPDRNRVFDAVIRLHPLVAVNTLDLEEDLQLQVGRCRPTPGGDESRCARLVRCFQSFPISRGREPHPSKHSRPSCWTQSLRRLVFGVLTAKFYSPFLLRLRSYPESSAQSTPTECTDTFNIPFSVLSAGYRPGEIHIPSRSSHAVAIDIHGVAHL